MSAGQIVTCPDCARLILYGQRCLCGWHAWHPRTTPTIPAGTTDHEQQETT